MGHSFFVSHKSHSPTSRAFLTVLGVLLFFPSCVSLKTHTTGIKESFEAGYKTGYQVGFDDCNQECLELQRQIAIYLDRYTRKAAEEIDGLEDWQK